MPHSVSPEELSAPQERPALPNDAPFVDVHALPTGHIHLPDRWLFEDGSIDTLHARQYSPDYSFLIAHPSGKKVLFDLGLRKELDNNPEIIQQDYPLISLDVPKDTIDILHEGPVSPTDIQSIIFSHLHFDHTGDCTKFPHAELIVGHGSHAATTPGWPRDPASPFLSSILEHPKFRELSFKTDIWQPLGPFERAHDFFRDGSLWLIDTPGHMPGHLGALAHTEPEEWVFMGGDCCHHRALLTGARPMSVSMGPNGTASFHGDPHEAKKTIRKLRDVQADGKVLVALPHDAMLDGLMPEYPDRLNGWKQSVWKEVLDEKVAKMYPA